MSTRDSASYRSGPVGWTTPLTIGLGAAVCTLEAAQAQSRSSEAADEMIVLGTYIKRPSQFDAPSPVVILSADDLAASGANKISDVIDRLTINTGSQNNPDAFTQNQTTGTSNVNLRGLGVSSTLVLVNGRREVQSAAATDRGENFVDTSALPPMIAFQQVEVLKDGATALYGSEAVAGVVNFVTRDRFDGFQLEATAQGVDGTPQRDLEISGLFGGGDYRTRALIAFSHLSRDMLTTADRRLSTTSDDLSQAGNPGTFLVPTRPANPVYGAVWASAYDTNHNGIADFVEPQLGRPPVPGAKPPLFADQSCTAIAAQDKTVIPAIAAAVPTPIGTVPLGLCEFDFGSFYSLVPKETRDNVFAELTRDMEHDLQGRIEVHFARNDAERDNSPSFPFAAFPVVPATHPDNPYGTDVQFIGRLVGAGGSASKSFHESDTWRLAATLAGSIGKTWSFDLGTTFSGNSFYVQANDVLKDRFNAALRGLAGFQCNPATGTPGVAPCAYYNPFGTALTGTGTPNSPDLIAFLTGQESFDARSDLYIVEGNVTRDLGALRGVPIRLAAGAEIRREKLSYDYDANANRDNFMFLVGNPDFSNDRGVEAAFVELSLPVAEDLNVQVAARYENYGDGVDSADPKISLLWRPTLNFSLRASAGTSFRAPSLFQAFGTQTSLAQLIDPRVGTPQFFPVRTQPNPNGAPLEPESADVLNIGVSYSPTPKLDLSLDYWSFDYSHVIVEQNSQALLNAAALGDSASERAGDPRSRDGAARARRLLLSKRVGAEHGRLRSIGRIHVRSRRERHAARRRRRHLHLEVRPRRSPSRSRRRRGQAQLRELRHVDAALARGRVRELAPSAARRQRVRPLHRLLRRRRGPARSRAGVVSADRERPHGRRAVRVHRRPPVLAHALVRRDQRVRSGSAARRDERRLRFESRGPARPRAVR